MIVSSAAARRATPYLGPYSATKAAQLSIAEAMRVELKPAKIAITSIHPIMTKTEFGRVAESTGQIKLPRGDAFTQSVDHVAKRMVAAIEKPTAEVWPSRSSRWVLGAATLMPRVVDRMMTKFRRDVEAENRTPQ
jgi:short-subunit dehydrogenase